MDAKLTERALILLEEASHAMDASANGLFDRGDLVLLISKFSTFTREVLDDGSQLAFEKKEMIRRLHRSPFPAEGDGHIRKAN